MNTLTKAFFCIPLTHTLLIAVATVILTIYLFTFQYILLACSIYIILFAYALLKNNTQTFVQLCTMLLFSLCTIISIHYQYNKYHNDQTFLNKFVTIEGTIKQLNHASLTKKQTTIIVQTNSIKDKYKALLHPKLITIFCPTETTQHLQLNQIIIAKHIQLNQPKQSSDYELYLIKEGIWATSHYNGNHIEIKQQIPLTIFQKTQLLLQEQLSSISFILFQPLFLGIKEKSHNNLIQQHQSIYWGIAHHMARSGVHLAILFAFLMLILHYAPCAYFIRYLVSGTILIGYACISQASISFIRALIMILLHITCKSLQRIPSTLHILTITTLLTLLHNPMQLFFLDFQLSFGITYIIVWLFAIKRNQTIVFNKQHFVRS